ncbi:MAG: hypothetical protein LBM93_10145 [Oscillospiraceae bacterium]|jgi:hypothetical protein|nr:hypothetical protein [Oscillospiraceae bacterium]
MKIVTKKNISIISITIIILAFIIVFFAQHKTYYKYNDTWIIGKHYTEIEKRYGKFDKGNGITRGGYYAGEWHDFHGTLPEYYFIYFDEEGYAIKIKKESHNPGG